MGDLVETDLCVIGAGSTGPRGGGRRRNNSLFGSIFDRRIKLEFHGAGSPPMAACSHIGNSTASFG
jgi:hypothetical protein